MIKSSIRIGNSSFRVYYDVSFMRKLIDQFEDYKPFSWRDIKDIKYGDFNVVMRCLVDDGFAEVTPSTINYYYITSDRKAARHKVHTNVYTVPCRAAIVIAWNEACDKIRL